MGLIDFVKSAGRALGIGGDEPAKPAAATPKAIPTVDPKLIDRRRAAALANTIAQTGFEVEELAVLVKGEVATVSGTVASQEIAEKVVLLVGNTQGIGQVDNRLTVANPAPEATYYTVQSGDTLSKIAKAQYGNAMKYPVIFEANRPMLADPDKIYPGQVLRIPPLEG